MPLAGKLFSLTDITFNTPGTYEVCINELETTCYLFHEFCTEITIVSSFRHFEEEVCITDIVGDWTPSVNDEGESWLGGPISLDDIVDGGGYVERETNDSRANGKAQTTIAKVFPLRDIQ